MAGDCNRNYVTIFAIFVTFLFLFSAPVASASGGGVTIESESINLVDFQTTDESYFELEFNLSSTDEGLGVNYVGQVYFEASAIDGSILTNSSISYDLVEGVKQQISYNFTSLNYGYTIISVGLTGDVGIESQNDLSNFQRTIHRLNPLNISIATESSIILESIDSNSILTGNYSLSDGDFVQFQIPIINSGDYVWTGSVNLSLDNGITSEQQSSAVFDVDGMATKIVYFNSTVQVFEGSFSISISLNGTIDDYITDNFQNFTASVNPPPLPILETSIVYDGENLVSGENLDITVQTYNNGSVDFSGEKTCLFDQEIVYNSAIIVQSSSNTNVDFTIILKPGELVCYLSGQRIDSSSINISTETFTVESALFEYAGSFTPSTTDGPWHVGDESTFSLLVRNTGTKQGNVSLKMESSAGNYQGSMVPLGPDEAGEVTITVPILVSGTEQFNWSLYSTDGGIADDISGEISLPVSERQSFELSLYDVSWTIDDGVTANWMVNLSSGIDREINVKLGFGSNLDDTIVYDVDMTISAGSSGDEFNFGFVEAEYVIISVQEINWTAESSFSSFTKSIPQDRPQYTISFNSQSNPNRPVAGETASVTVLLENQGPITGESGTIILYDRDGFKLAESSTTPITAGSSETISFSFAWPEGDEVRLNCKWDYGSDTLQINNIFLSSIVTEDSSDSFSIPWSGILGGLAVSSLIVLTIRIRENSNRQPKKQKSEVKNRKTESVKLSDVKIEISCPVCSRQLRVPENYQGSVRCPDCSHSFEVGSEDLDEEEVQEEEELIENNNDGKVEISCPECSQSLRIPESYDGSVRCPSCKMIFKSKDG